MKKKKTSRLLLIIFLGVIILIVAYYTYQIYFLFNDGTLECRRLYQEKFNLEQNVKYCTIDSDCIYVGSDCCGLLINKKEVDIYSDKVRELFANNCVQIECDCFPSPTQEEIKCRDGNCIDLSWENYINRTNKK